MEYANNKSKVYINNGDSVRLSTVNNWTVTGGAKPITPLYDDTGAIRDQIAGNTEPTIVSFTLGAFEAIKLRQSFDPNNEVFFDPQLSSFDMTVVLSDPTLPTRTITIKGAVFTQFDVSGVNGSQVEVPVSFQAKSYTIK